MADSLTPEELTEQMFAAVGRAITQWSFVEAELGDLFVVCVGGASVRPHGGLEYIEHWVPTWVFHAAEAFNTKRSLIDAALTAHVWAETPNEDEIKSEWAKLSDKGRKLSHKRNKLAHWFVLPAQRTGTAAEHEPIAPARLMPPYRSPKYWRETGLKPAGVTLTVKQIGHIELAFRLYADKVRAFSKKLASEEALRDKSARQALPVCWRWMVD